MTEIDKTLIALIFKSLEINNAQVKLLKSKFQKCLVNKILESIVYFNQKKKKKQKQKNKKNKKQKNKKNKQKQKQKNKTKTKTKQNKTQTNQTKKQTKQNKTNKKNTMKNFECLYNNHITYNPYHLIDD